MSPAPPTGPSEWQEPLAALLARIGSASAAEVQQTAETIYAAALAAGQPAAAAQVALELGLALHETVDAADSLIWLGRALAHYQAVGDTANELVATALMALRTGVMPEGAPSAALHLARCIEIGAAAALNPQQRFRVNQSLAGAYQGLGLTEAALRIDRLQCELAQQVFGPNALPSLLAQFNFLNGLRYRIEESNPFGAKAVQAPLQEALERLPAVMPSITTLPAYLQIYARTVCGLLLARGGRADEAEAQLRQALQLEAVAHSDYTSTARVELALLLQQQGQPDEARALAAQARTSLWRGRAGLGELEVWEWRALAQLAPVHGDWREAHDCQQRLAAVLSRNAMCLLDAKVSALARRVNDASLRLQYDDLRELNRDLSRQASTDALTGTLNRKALLASHEQLGRPGRALALLMVDVDHFKSVNDRFGHPVGDAVLCTLAQLLQQALRGPDRVARFGGEEFAVLLADADHAKAAAVAERLRGDVENHDWAALVPGAQTPLALTISVGVAASDAGETLDAMVGRADEALYRAKRAGRNRVEWAR